MQFVEAKLNEQGKVSTLHTMHDSLTSKDWGPFKYVWEVSEAAFDPQSCQMTWREIHTWPSLQWGAWDSRLSLSLREVSRLEVLALQDQLNRQSAKGGHPETVSAVSPEVSVMTIYMSRDKSVRNQGHKTEGESGKNEPVDSDDHFDSVEIHFAEDEVAQRTAKALVHAVELCGGGNKDPF